MARGAGQVPGPGWGSLGPRSLPLPLPLPFPQGPPVAGSTVHPAGCKRRMPSREAYSRTQNSMKFNFPPI